MGRGGPEGQVLILKPGRMCRAPGTAEVLQVQRTPIVAVGERDSARGSSVSRPQLKGCSTTNYRSSLPAA